MDSSGQISTGKNFFAGGFGGICLVAAGHPLDTVKVRIQTMPLPVAGQAPIYLGTFDCISKIFTREGLGGFYKGMATPLVGVTPMYALTFMGYSVGLKLQQHAENNGSINNKIDMRYFYAGMFSALFTTPLNGPGERVKCLLQVQSGNSSNSVRYKGPIDCVYRLYGAGGFRSVFRGTFATLLRDVPGNGVYFLTYETIKMKLRPRDKPNQDLDAISTLVAGGVAGILFWVVGIPPDVIKSRLQTTPESRYPNGIRDVFREIIRQEGVSGLYKGATAVFLRAFPANSCCLLGYEVAMQFLHWLSPNT